jgi:alpha-mannosidase
MEVRVLWNEKDRMLKLAFPVNLINPAFMGQVPYGIQEFSAQGEELVAQKWVAAYSLSDDFAVTIANRSTYGFDFSEGQLRISLLRSPAYAGHPVGDRQPIVRQDRFTPRMDQGEHLFSFHINAGPLRERLIRVEQECRLLNVPPPALCCFPGGRGEIPLPAVTVSNPAIRLAAMKLAEAGKRIIIRLFETTGYPARAEVLLPGCGAETSLVFRPFEIKTLAVDTDLLSVDEVNLIES